MIHTLTGEQKDKLVKRLKTSAEEISELLKLTDKSADIVTLDQARVGRLSRMDAMQQQQMASEGKRRQQLQLKQIISALKRADTGAYGYCVACDESIPFARLEIRPESELCVDCQQQQESR